jgi:hypothetical protein
MATWEATKDYLRDHYNVVLDMPGFVEIAFDIESAAEQAPHGQRIELDEQLGESVLRIFTHVMSDDNMPAGEALAMNLALSVGALAACRGSYVLHHVLPLADLSLARLRRDMEVLLCEAEALRRVHASPFAAFQD